MSLRELREIALKLRARWGARALVRWRHGEAVAWPGAKLAVVLVLLCRSAHAQMADVESSWKTFSPFQAQGTPAASRSESSPPWLVTVIHRISVRDLLENVRRQGMQASVLDGLIHSQYVTNVTTGLVVDERGRILVRLMNLSPEQREADVRVVTSDGRIFRPTLLGCDEATGYAVLEVPSLGIAPPAFVREGLRQEADTPVRILAPVPEIERLHEALRVDSTDTRDSASAPRPVGKGTFPSWRELLPVKIKLEAARLKAQTPVEASADVPSDRAPSSSRSTWLVELPDESWSADGGVVLNERGEVLGVAEEQGAQQYVMRSMENLRALVGQLVARARSSRSAVPQDAPQPRPSGWIGVRVANLQELKESERAAFPPSAVVVMEVIPGSPAERAGVQPGDALVQYRGQQITSVEMLAQLIAQTPVGISVPVTIWRKGDLQHLLIPIEERPRSVSAENPTSVSRPSAPAAPVPRWTPTRLGLRLMDLTEQLADFFGVRLERGVLILEVIPGGPAAAAGLQAGDVLIGIGSISIRNRADMLRALRELTADVIPVRLVRNRERLVVNLRLPSN